MVISKIHSSIIEIASIRQQVDKFKQDTFKVIYFTV